jgi:hypothetical protein
MDYSVEGLPLGSRKLGLLHYRRDYGSVVYSEWQISLWWLTILISLEK